MDRVKIVGLQISAKHGYYAEERLQGNQFEVDVQATLKNAYTQMSVPSDTFDYEGAAIVVKEVFAGKTQLFLEDLALEIGTIIWKDYQAKLATLNVSIRKINPAICLSSSFSEVTLCWPRSI